MEGKAKVENGNRIDRVIRREEAAELLGNSRAHAHQASVKISQRAVGYRESVIEAYIASREAVR